MRNLFSVEGKVAVVTGGSRGIGEMIAFSDPGMLSVGTQYRLTAFAVAEALSDATPATTSGDASYNVILFLPEPSQNAALTVGIAALAGLRRLQRYRQVRGNRERANPRGRPRTAALEPQVRR